MTLLQGILRALFVAMGTTELITNARYLFVKDALEKARKQHGEIPKNVTTQQLRRKVLLMFIFGALFFMLGISAYLFHTYPKNLFTITASLFSIYALCEALYYKYWKTFSFFGTTIVLLLLCILS